MPQALTSKLFEQFTEEYRRRGTIEERRAWITENNNTTCVACVRKNIPCVPEREIPCCEACKALKANHKCSRTIAEKKSRLMHLLSIDERLYDVLLEKYHKSKGLEPDVPKSNASTSKSKSESKTRSVKMAEEIKSPSSRSLPAQASSGPTTSSARAGRNTPVSKGPAPPPLKAIKKPSYLAQPQPQRPTAPVAAKGPPPVTKTVNKVTPTTMLTRPLSSSTPLNVNSTKKILVTMVSDSDPESELEQKDRSRPNDVDIIPETDHSSDAYKDDEEKKCSSRNPSASCSKNKNWNGNAELVEDDDQKNQKTKQGKGKGIIQPQSRTALDEADFDSQPSKMKTKATGARTEGNGISNKRTEVDEFGSDVPTHSQVQHSLSSNKDIDKFVQLHLIKRKVILVKQSMQYVNDSTETRATVLSKLEEIAADIENAAASHLYVPGLGPDPQSQNAQASVDFAQDDGERGSNLKTSRRVVEEVHEHSAEEDRKKKRQRRQNSLSTDNDGMVEEETQELAQAPLKKQKTKSEGSDTRSGGRNIVVKRIGLPKKKKAI